MPRFHRSLKPLRPLRPRRIAARIAALLCAGALAWPAGQAWAAPRVVASVPPLHALAASVMQGAGTPDLLFEGGSSPHAAALAPSDARGLARADLVLWVGPVLEGALARPMRNVVPADARLAATGIAGVRLLAARPGGIWRSGHARDQGQDHADTDGHVDADHADDAGAHGHGHGDVDPHLWLDPDNAAAIVAALAARLADLDPGNGALYRRNAERATARIAALDRELADRLRPLAGRPYLVFHDAYQYFEAHYGLNATGALALGPQRLPGARRLLEVRAEIRRTRAACVFREPQFPPDLVRTVVEGTDARIGVLDPLGAGLEPGPEMWFTLMRGLAASLESCLSPAD